MDTDQSAPPDGHATEVPVSPPPSTPPPQPSRLLALPAELRNRIYEFSLISNDTIKLTPSLQPPALLQTNREIRHEATKIWYFRNAFRAEITDCDAVLMCRFHTHIMGKFPRHNEFGRMTVTQEFDPDTLNWGNLMTWCKMIFEGKGFGPRPDEGLDAELSVICAATDVAYQMRRGGGKWENCEMALRTVRCMAGNMDEMWLDDD